MVKNVKGHKLELRGRGDHLTDLVCCESAAKTTGTQTENKAAGQPGVELLVLLFPSLCFKAEGTAAAVL